MAWELADLNCSMFKEVFYDSSLSPNCNSVNFTIISAHQNALINQIIITLAQQDNTFGPALSIAFYDRGNGYPYAVNGLNPVTFATFSTAATSALPSNFITQESIIQHGNVITVNVGQPVQDSEGIGCIYMNLTRLFGVFNISFTMVVVYQPQQTYNQKLDNRSNLSDCKTWRALTQLGTSTSAYVPNTQFFDMNNQFARQPYARQNIEISTFGFSVSTSNPVFYVGAPTPVNRWYMGFSSDCTKYLNGLTFAYWNGNLFQALTQTSNTYPGVAPSQLYNGCAGPGTYQGAYDGVITINGAAITNWQPVRLPNDPLTIYNNTMIGLGTLATNNVAPNPAIYWVQCTVGFGTTTGTVPYNSALTIATLAPLISPTQPFTYRRKLI